MKLKSQKSKFSDFILTYFCVEKKQNVPAYMNCILQYVVMQLIIIERIRNVSDFVLRIAVHSVLPNENVSRPF